MKKFPHLVQMHNKFAAQGLVCISLNPVDGTDSKLKSSALKFLQEQNATFANFLLMDSSPPQALAEKYPTDVTPTLIIFNRQGERVHVLDEENDLQPARVEQLIQQLLNEQV